MTNVIETFLQNGGGQIQKLDGVETPVVIIGNQQQEISLEPYLAAPLRTKELRKFDDLRGFVGYINDYKTETTAAFANRDRIEVVFDYHSAASRHAVSIQDSRPPWE